MQDSTNTTTSPPSQTTKDSGIKTTTVESQQTSAVRMIESGFGAIQETIDSFSRAREEQLREVKAGRRPAHLTGSLRPDQLGANHPTITVLGTEGREPNILGTYDDFILSGAQEQDAEKGYVVETFGAPYIFATGRFVRKYTFTGKLRTTPTNHSARGASIRALRARTPQFQMFRVFYDKYLRMSEQIKYGRFTRITVDGETYEGFVSTMNLGREATVETIADFNFTFIGIRRGGRHDTDAAAVIRPSFDTARSTQPAMPESVATAELKDALGELELSVTTQRDGTGAGKSAAITGTGGHGAKMTRSETNISKAGTVSLLAEGTPQVLRVRTSALGVDLVYRGSTPSSSNSSSGGSTPVHNSLATITPSGGVGRAMDLRVTSYRALFNYLYQKSTGNDPTDVDLDFDKQTAKGEVSFEILSDVADPVTVVYNLELEGRETWSITEMEVKTTFNGAANNAESSDKINYNGGEFTGFTDGATAGAVDTGNIVPFQITMTVHDGTGNPLDSAVFLSAPTFAVEHSQVTAVIGENAVPAPGDTDGGKSSVTGKIQGVPSIVGDAAKSQFVVTGNLVITKLVNGAVSDLQDQSRYIFISADRLLASIKFNLGVPGLAPEQRVRDNGGQEVSFRIFGKTPVSTGILQGARASVQFGNGLTARNSAGKQLSSMGSIQYDLKTNYNFQADFVDAIRKNGRMVIRMQDARLRGGPDRPVSIPVSGGHARIVFPPIGSDDLSQGAINVGIPIDIQVAVRGGSTNTGSPYAMSYRGDFNFVETSPNGAGATTGYAVIIDFTVSDVDLILTGGGSISAAALVRQNPDAYLRYVQRYISVGLDLSATGLGKGIIEAKR